MLQMRIFVQIAIPGSESHTKKISIISLKCRRKNTMGFEKNCSTCYWHFSFSWTCLNRLSPKCTEITDPEDGCRFWQKRSEYDHETSQKNC